MFLTVLPGGLRHVVNIQVSVLRDNYKENNNAGAGPGL